MLVAGLESEKVTCDIEGADLPPSVGQNFGRPDRAADDLVQILSRLAFSVDFVLRANGIAAPIISIIPWYS